AVISVSYSPDGKQVAASTAQGLVGIWDTNKDKSDPLTTLGGPQDRINSVAWSPDGKFIAAASEDKSVTIWDAVKWGKALVTIQDTTAQLSVTWSTDSKRVASGCADNSAKIWDAIAGGKALQTLGEHTGRVRSVAWSPDGARLLTGSD